MSDDPPSDEVFALLDDEYARAILTATSTQPMSAKELGDECDASLPTVYRRVERLVETGLLEERTRVADHGRHYSVYRARLRRLSVELDDGELRVSVDAERDDMADRFTDMWEEL